MNDNICGSGHAAHSRVRNGDPAGQRILHAERWRSNGSPYLRAFKIQVTVGHLTVYRLEPFAIKKLDTDDPAVFKGDVLAAQVRPPLTTLFQATTFFACQKV